MPLQNFINQTSKFIKDSGIDLLYPPEISRVEYEEEGLTKAHFSFVDNFGSNVSISDNSLLQIIIIFSLLDVYVDKSCPNLEGESFKYKYDNLPTSTDEELVLKNVYRIFKTLRNSIVHNISSTNISSGNINISYSFRNTLFSVSCDLKTISNLYTIVYMIANAIGNTYREKTYLRTFYSELISNITLQDEITANLDSLTDTFIFQSISRIRIELLETQYELKNNTITFKNEYLAGKRSQPYLNVDLSFSINNIKYLIPEELITNHSILATDMENWVEDNQG